MKKILFAIAIVAATVSLSSNGFSYCEPSTNPRDGACQQQEDGSTNCVPGVCNAQGAPCKALAES